MKTVIISIIYREPEWTQTKGCIEATEAPVLYVERRPDGWGSLTEAVNRGLDEALERYPLAQFFWVVTNVIFTALVLPRLEAVLTARPQLGMVHPVFESDHLFCRPVGGPGLREVPFVELTAPLIRREVLEKVGRFDEAMPYWGQDLDYGLRVRAAGYQIGVDPQTSVSHVYLRLLNKRVDVSKFTRRRRAARKAADAATRERLVEKYGPDWGRVTGRYT
jgi:hypothetical protein